MTRAGGRAPVRPPATTPVELLAPPPAATTTEVAACTAADLPHVYGLALCACDDAGPGRRRVVETLLEDVVFVARSGRRPVGFVALGGVPEDALVVDELLVAPGHEPSDVGDVLLLEAERWGATEHARALRVVVRASDWAARGFFRRRGFVLVGPDVLELSLPA